MNMQNGDPHTALLQTEVPAQLLQDARILVDRGWYQDIDELVLDALQQFLETRRLDIDEEQIRNDVEWGLRGTE